MIRLFRGVCVLTLASLIGVLTGCGGGSEPAADDIPLAPPLAEKKFTLDMANGVKMEFAAIPPGRFAMAIADGKRRKRVAIAKPFYMSRTEVTQKQWLDLMPKNPSIEEKGDDFPVHRLDWGDCQDFLRRLNQKYGAKTGMKFDLPTEAQWEYACLANTDDADDATAAPSFAWLGSNSGNRMHPVGKKVANRFGLFDMQGNVYEWCSDRVNQSTGKSVRDDLHAVRGGCWREGPSQCTARAREQRRATVPLRVADGLRLICYPAK